MTVEWIDPAVSHPPDTHSVLVTYVADGARFVSLGWFSPGGKWLSEFGDELEVVAWAKLPPPAGVAGVALRLLRSFRP